MLPLDRRRALEKIVAMSERGWCPFARQHRGYGREGPFGYPAGKHDQNRPVVFVDHRMAGYKRTLDDDFWRHKNGVSVHFGIGRDGSVDQYTSIFDASWANGVGRPISRYDRSNPRLAMLETLGTWRAVTMHGYTTYALISESGVNVINTHSISIEHEDEGRDQPWTDAMIEATVRVKRWCLHELARAAMPMAVDEHMLVGHYQIDATDRASCPGRHWPRQRILEELVKGGKMPTAEYEELYRRDEEIKTVLALVNTKVEQLQNLMKLVIPLVAKDEPEENAKIKELLAALGGG